MSDSELMATRGAGMRKALPMKQLPADEIAGESPLHNAALPEMAGRASDAAGIVFQEQARLGLLTLRATAGSGAQLDAFEQAVGLALPTRPLTASAAGDRVVRWLSPDEWLITLPGEGLHDLELRVHELMPGHYALVNVSGGLTVWKLSGDRVTDLLRKCVPVDLHPDAFPIGKVVSTLFAKSGATLRREGPDAFELVVRRSYSDYLWRWIRDASLEYGLVIQAGGFGDIA